MREIKYPKTNIVLSSDIKILLDANIFLNELYDDTIIGDTCAKVTSNFKKNNVQVFLSNVVISETINRILYREFITDMYYKIDDVDPMNTRKAIDKIVAVLNSYKNIKFTLDDKTSLDKTNLTLCFNNLNKDKKNRYMLKPYFDSAIDIYNEFKKDLNIKHLVITEDIYNKALENFQCQMIGLNDAQHLQVAIDNDIDYIVTNDKDFNFVAQSFKTQILKIDRDSVLDDVAAGD